MKHKMTLGPCEVCPDCDGHKRVVCSCVPRNVDDVAEMVGAVGCPECDGDGDHWCPMCMGNGAVPRKIACICDENCDEPCRACNRPTVQAARTAYRMGRKDARRYAARSTGEAHVDSQTVERIAALIWTATRRAALPSQYDDLCDREQTKLRMVAQEALSAVGAALLRALDEAPEEPVHIESIARAAEMSIFDVEHDDPCALGHE